MLIAHILPATLVIAVVAYIGLLMTIMDPLMVFIAYVGVPVATLLLGI